MNCQQDQKAKPKTKRLKKNKKTIQRPNIETTIAQSVLSNRQKDEQEPNKIQDQSINDYLEAIQLLESQDIKDKMNKELRTQLTFMETLQCQICFLNFDTNNRKPTKWCRSIHPGYICTLCLKNIKQCHLCRKDLEPKFAKEDLQLICWLHSSEKLGIVIPTVFQTIPKELHETLKKIKIHQFYRKEKAREVMKKRQAQASLIKLNYTLKALKTKMDLKQKEYDFLKVQFSNTNQEFENKKKQVQTMTQWLQGKRKKMLEAKQEFQLMSYMIDSKIGLNYSEKSWEKILELKNQISGERNRIFQALDEYTKAIKDNIIKHQNQAHEGKPYHRLYGGQVFQLLINRNPSTFLYRERRQSESCSECGDLNIIHAHTIGPIQVRISNHNKKLHQILNNKAQLIAHLIQKFVPENLNDCKQKIFNAFRLMDIEEDRLIERMLTSEIEEFDVEKFRAQINEIKMDEEMQEKQENLSK